MTGAARTAWLGAALAALSGCLNPATTRLPTLAPAPNAVERRSLGHFDPLPDRDLGPDTDSRPREFLEAREPQRQAQEGRLLQGAPAAPVAPGFSTGAYRDGDVVR
ncbi:MAG TPA: hypothetical protein VF170_18385 [Planctomycetaceae bacterium]